MHVTISVNSVNSLSMQVKTPKQLWIIEKTDVQWLEGNEKAPILKRQVRRFKRQDKSRPP